MNEIKLKFKSFKFIMIEVLVLVLLLILFTILVIYAPWNISYDKSTFDTEEGYSYLQHLEPEDEVRTTRDLEVDENAVTTGCGCGALSPFETSYYMQGAQCTTRMSDQYPGDPGYFLGRTVI